MTVPFAVGAEVTRADIPCLCAGLADLLRGRPDTGQVICDVSAARPDVVTVEALARLRLTAGRHGWRFSTHGATDDLLTLFSLMGLGGFFFSGRQAHTEAPGRQAHTETAGHPAHTEAPGHPDRMPAPHGPARGPAPGEPARKAAQSSAWQARGQAEEREQALGVEEVVESGDPPV